MGGWINKKQLDHLEDTCMEGKVVYNKLHDGIWQSQNITHFCFAATWLMP